MAVFGTPNNTLVLGPFLVGPKTDQKFTKCITYIKNNYKTT
jgi:hypothetical protein